MAVNFLRTCWTCTRSYTCLCITLRFFFLMFDPRSLVRFFVVTVNWPIFSALARFDASWRIVDAHWLFLDEKMFVKSLATRHWQAHHGLLNRTILETRWYTVSLKHHVLPAMAESTDHRSSVERTICRMNPRHDHPSGRAASPGLNHLARERFGRIGEKRWQKRRGGTAAARSRGGQMWRTGTSRRE